MSIYVTIIQLMSIHQLVFLLSLGLRMIVMSKYRDFGIPERRDFLEVSST